MDFHIADSQANEMEWVPDSQARPRNRGHLQHIKKAFLGVIFVVISGLVEIIMADFNQPSFPDNTRVRDGLNEDDRNICRRQFRVWSHFLQQLLSTLRLLQFVFDSDPMRRIHCPWYIKPRTIEWFYLYIDYSPYDDPERFRQFFRISPQMFTQICDMVRPTMASNAPDSFHVLPNRHLLVERQVAVALRRLATGDTLLGIGELFGLSKTTASRVTWKFIQSFCEAARHYLHWPQGNDMEEVKSGFQERWGFPNCCGAIDVTHFEIEVPAGENASHYYDWKHNKSITMQAVVDNRCRFLDVLIGCPGSTNDSRLLRMSSLYHNVVHDHTKLNGPDFVTPSGYRVREYLLGDKGYPLYNWLIVPFPRNVNEANDRWNKRHSSARMCVERSFGRLKGMWRILSRIILKPKVERLAPTVLTCVLLHNMMIHHGEEVPPQVWNDAAPHSEGYANRPRRCYEMFAGGRQAREALRLSIHNNIL